MNTCLAIYSIVRRVPFFSVLVMVSPQKGRPGHFEYTRKSLHKTYTCNRLTYRST